MTEVDGSSAAAAPPDQERRFWFWDASHFPRPVTPACETIDLVAMQAGFIEAARLLERALPAPYVRVENGYVYFGLDLPRDEAELARREAASAIRIQAEVGRALRRWHAVYWPEADGLTLALASMPRIIALGAGVAHAVIESFVEIRTRQWRIHDLALVPAMEAAARFTATYAPVLGGAAAAQTLLQGYPNRATEAAEALAALAEAVRERPAVAEAVRAGRTPDRGDGGDSAWFHERLDAYLDQYGDRAEGWDLGAPSWREDPGPVLARIRDRLGRPPADPAEPRRRAAAAREAAFASAIQRLPPEQRGRFVTALVAARAYPIVSEDHNAVIDQAGMVALRAALVAVGRHLVEAGAIDRPTDVVWLRLAEVRAALTARRRWQQTVTIRKAAHADRQQAAPPRTLGAPLPDWALRNPTLSGFFGLTAEAATATGALTGAAVSTGVVTGRAFVARTLAEAEGIGDGDVLVCPMTAPSWTPWLSVAAAVVVETGGLLSHTAVLTREYGIPCVAGVRGATNLIPHGALVTVDGSAGTVTWTPA